MMQKYTEFLECMRLLHFTLAYPGIQREISIRITTKNMKRNEQLMMRFKKAPDQIKTRCQLLTHYDAIFICRIHGLWNVNCRS